MGFTPVRIDDSINNIEAGGAVRVPEGTYLFSIQGVTPSKEDYDGKPYFRFRLKIEEGQYAVGRSLSHLFSFAEKAAFRTGQLLAAIGVDQSKMAGMELPTYKHFAAFAESLDKALRGRKVGGEVGDNEYNGKVTSQVYEFFPASQYQERAGSRVTAPTSPPTNSSGAAVKAATDGEIADLLSSAGMSLGG